MYRGKTVFITGGAGGIGMAIARRFAADGARIALFDLRQEAVDSATAALRAGTAEVLGIAGDLTCPEDCVGAVAKTSSEFGGIDVLVHCAGLTQVGPFIENDLSVYRRVMEVNFFGAVHMTRCALDALVARRGQIVVLSSIAGFAPLLGRTGYCASKHALHGFFDTLRCELAGHGVGVTVVCPSFVDTRFADRGLDSAGQPLGFDRSTTGKFLSPDAVAEAIFHAARKRKRLLVLSTTGKLAWWVSRLAPGFYERSMTRRFQIELERHK
ncbi:MAG: SDR family oxidoreductase [Candidatus Hydrogenedentes bacterium]|nr:SDR family oxidoreductase [Candidatus Hydrogenedentota bacterium]